MSENRRTPQEKKILSYLKDRRGSYAKNQKTGRNAVRKHKAHVSRSYRRSTTQLSNICTNIWGQSTLSLI